MRVGEKVGLPWTRRPAIPEFNETLWFVVLAAGRMKDDQVRWGEEQMLEE